MPLRKQVGNTHRFPEGWLMEISCLQCPVQHSAHRLFNIRLSSGAERTIFFIMHRPVR